MSPAERKALVAPITGTADGVPFSGMLRVTRFEADGESIVAIAKLTSVAVADDTGAASLGALRSVQRRLELGTYRIPVSFPQQGGATSGGAPSRTAVLACDVLFLQLGPLDLNLLGLVVHLDQVTLDIDAVAGGGELLGNLLCAITALLDPIGFIQNILQIVDLLNDLIDLIGEL